MFLYEEGEEVGAGAVDDVVDLFEATVSAAPGVRDPEVVVGAIVGRLKIAHQPDFSAERLNMLSWQQVDDVASVAGVHSDDAVKVIEVLSCELLRALVGDVDLMVSSDANAARVGSFADVVCAGAGGGDREEVGEASVVDVCLEEPFGEGGTADISKADKDYFDAFVHCGCSSEQRISGTTASSVRYGCDGLLAR